MEQSKEEILQKAYQPGLNYEKEYAGCGQTVLAAIQDILGMENEAVFEGYHPISTAAH